MHNVCLITPLADLQFCREGDVGKRTCLHDHKLLLTSEKTYSVTSAGANRRDDTRACNQRIPSDRGLLNHD
jgi:hypothetical protein